MEMLQIVFIPILTVLLNFIAKPLEIYLYRKRTGSVNSIRVITEFFYRYRKPLKEVDENELIAEIEQCLQYPNSLGSEAQIAKLVGMVSSIINIPSEELRKVDLALNALDQRATERERARK